MAVTSARWLDGQRISRRRVPRRRARRAHGKRDCQPASQSSWCRAASAAVVLSVLFQAITHIECKQKRVLESIAISEHVSKATGPTQ